MPTGAFVVRRNGKVFVTGNSGFPKSMDISKAIDRSNGENRARQLEFTEWMRSTGVTARQIDEATGTNMGGHYLTDKSQPAIATADLFDLLRPLLPEVPERIERLVAERTGIEWTDYVKREVVGKNRWTNSANHFVPGEDHTARVHTDITAPASDAAKRWSGWGTALKPAIEPIILARKPLDGTVAANVLAHGVGGLNIDASRVATDEKLLCHGGAGNKATYGEWPAEYEKGGGREYRTGGRFPANVLLDEHAAKEMDRQSGVMKSRGNKRESKSTYVGGGATAFPAGADSPFSHDEGGGASRFFPVFKYQAKAPKKERPVVVRDDGTKVQHPTVKPLALMEWLVTLTTPEGGTILDPFAGTGTTLQAARDKGFTAIGIEQDPDYIQLIHARLATAAAEGGLF